MTNPENDNLLFTEGKTELHINPKGFKRSGLRELSRQQIFAQTAEITLISNGARVVISPSAMNSARNLFGENRKRFLDKIVSAMCDAEEIIIKGIAVNRNETNKPRDLRYNNVFRDFINTNPRLAYLEK